MIGKEDITGLVLCGGLGTRMGGVDKGLQMHRGVPLALHALLRLQLQVGATVINANRNLAAYEAFGVEVCLDTVTGHPGPLAGWLAGLSHCMTPLLVTVPCDTPDFPTDLVLRLAQGLEQEDADLAIAYTVEDGQTVAQPVFCLLKTALEISLADYVNGGGRKVMTWAQQHRCAKVVFDEPRAFFNANTRAELAQLQTGPGG
jgi:molybdenum cofactor guanylyltransferase